MRVFMVGGRRLVADALLEMLNGEPGLRVVGTAATADAALDRLRLHAADVVLIDASDDREHALSTVCRLRDGPSPARLLVFGIADEIDDALEFVEAGAAAVVPLDAPLAELIAAAVDLPRRRTRCPPALAVRVVERLRQLGRGEPRRQPPGHQLSPRQREVLSLLADGLTNKEIAQRLGVAVATVKNHVHGLLGELGVHRRQDAVRTAYLAGLIDDFLPRRAARRAPSGRPLLHLPMH